MDLSRSQLAILRGRINELEVALENTRKECGKTIELNAKLKFDLQEVFIVNFMTDSTKKY